jgi:hypothetical protein
MAENFAAFVFIQAHLTPAGLPLGIPGIGEEIEGAVQQAPQGGIGRT